MRRERWGDRGGVEEGERGIGEGSRRERGG